MRRPQQIRKYVVYALYLLLFSTVQVTFPGIVTFYGLRADLMFVLVVLCSYMFGFYDGIVFGALAGIIYCCRYRPVSNGSGGSIRFFILYGKDRT